MLWDAAWDQQNVIEGKVYSDHIADIMSRSGGPSGPTTAPGTGAASTAGGSTPSGSTPSGSTPGGSTPTPPSPGGGEVLVCSFQLTYSCLEI